MSDFSKMSIQELAERYFEERKRVESGESLADLEALETELQKRIGTTVGEIWWNSKEAVYSLARSLAEAVKQYKKEI
ncbi:MAG TPA: hypothetical protein VEY68_02370 [Anoxybacillus sp.]|nr:hypothetical protein [Anoxybacillus sp.]